MNEAISSTHHYLLQRYGPMLTLKHVAEVMHTTPNGIRMAVARWRQPFAVALAGARRKLGRRVYFEARRIAAVIDQGYDKNETSSSPPTAGKHPAPGARQQPLPLSAC